MSAALDRLLAKRESSSLHTSIYSDQENAPPPFRVQDAAPRLRSEVVRLSAEAVNDALRGKAAKGPLSEPTRGPVSAPNKNALEAVRVDSNTPWRSRTRSPPRTRPLPSAAAAAGAARAPDLSPDLNVSSAVRGGDDNSSVSSEYNSSGSLTSSPTPRLQRRSRSRSATAEPVNGMRFHPNPHIAAFLQDLPRRELVPCKAVEASGLGVSAVLLRGSRDGGTASPPTTLPTRPWMTNTTVTAVPYVVLQCAAADYAHRELVSYREPTTTAPGERTEKVRDIVVFLIVDGVVGPSGAVKHTPVTVKVACSHHPKTGFVRVGRVTETTEPVVSVTIPGTLMGPFLRITVHPAHTTRQLRVSALALMLAAQWTQRTERLPQITPLSPEEEMEREMALLLSRPHDEGSLGRPHRAAPRASPSTVREDHPAQSSTISSVHGGEGGEENSVFEPEPRQPPATSPVEQDGQAVRLGAATPQPEPTPPCAAAALHRGRSAPEPLTDSARARRTIAAEMKRRAVAAALQTRREGAVMVEYNWLNGEAVTRETPEATSMSTPHEPDADAAVRETNSKKTASADRVEEYVDAMNAWDAASQWSLAEALSFALSQSPAFSLSVCGSTAEGVAAAMVQPLPVSLIVAVTGSAPSPQHTPETAVLSPLSVLASIADYAATRGRCVELAFRLPRGFCCALRPRAGVFGGEVAVQPMWVVVLLGSSAELATELLHTTCSLYERGGAAELGTLRLVLDYVGEFAVLLPALRRWVQIGPVQYYGEENQTLLSSLQAEAEMERQSLTDVRAKGNAPASASSAIPWTSWAGVRLHGRRLIVKLPSCHGAATRHAFLQVSVQAHRPLIHVWQPGSRRDSPRVVLADVHLLTALPMLNGALVPASMAAAVAERLLGKDSRESQKLVTMTEEPWRLLATKVRERAQGTMLHTSAAVERERDMAARNLRYRVTSTCVFHTLSTAFRRDWAVVGLYLPVRLLHSVGGAGNEETSLLSVDEDAFLDTVLRWSYPCPRTIVVFYHSLRDTAAGESDEAVQEATAPDGGRRMARVGPFSRSALESFVTVRSLEEALS